MLWVNEGRTGILLGPRSNGMAVSFLVPVRATIIHDDVQFSFEGAG